MAGERAKSFWDLTLAPYELHIYEAGSYIPQLRMWASFRE
jgi:hypothetical protein